jgi:rhodanese-related sulfurtransferase
MADHRRRHTLEELFADAQARISRFAPGAAYAAVRQGALVVDIRSDLDRERDGIVPGSVHIPRTVLEWRTDLDSPWRSPYVGGLDQQIVVLCDHGCSSVFAAAVLVDLGFTHAGDVIGGFAAWRDAGLPVGQASRRRRSPDELPGMGPPDP